MPLPLAVTVEQIVTVIQAALDAVDNISLARKQKNGKLTQVERFDLSTLHHQLQFGKTKIDKWRELWIIGNDKSELFFMRLWGEDGQTKILDLLSVILQESSLIVNSARLVVNQLDEPKKTTQRQRSNLKWLRRHWTHNSSEISKSSDQPADVVQLKENVSRVIDHLSDLWTDADAYFRRLHASGVFSDLNKFRQIPTALYELLGRQERPLYLDLRLLNNRESARDFFKAQESSVDFHCIFQSPGSETQAQHLVLKAVGHLPLSDSNDEDQGNFAYDSLQLSEVKSKSRFSFLLPIKNSSSSQAVFAESYTSNMFEEYRAENCVFRSMSVDNSPRPPRLTLQHKFSIAIQLAEATLVLLGTPWLNDLSSDKIRRLRIDETQHHLCLYIDPSRPVDSEKTSQFQTVQQRQIFALGVMLLEIALETPIHKRWKEGEDPGDIWQSYQLDYNRKVERIMGTSYGKACEFCFLETVTEGGPEEDAGFMDESTDSLFDLEELVEGYHSEVFTRLRETMKLI